MAYDPDYDYSDPRDEPDDDYEDLEWWMQFPGEFAETDSLDLMSLEAADTGAEEITL